MDKFFRELESEDIHIRDRWQFELKSEFYSIPNRLKNSYIQEFFVFVPNSLRINKNTYLKDDFFRDQSNFIRYKTPVFSFSEINSTTNRRSPLFRIRSLLEMNNLRFHKKEIEDELKLLGNILRSCIRTRVLLMYKLLQSGHSIDKVEVLSTDIDLLKKELEQFYASFEAFKEMIASQDAEENLIKHYEYVEEFINNSIYYYLLEFLKLLRRKKIAAGDLDQKLCTIISSEFKKLKVSFPEIETLINRYEQNEYILYRAGLLNKFVLDALLLNTSCKSSDSKIKHFVGSFAAGIAMLFYFVLFVWQGQVFLMDSAAFILTAVILYILKDRIKEGLKTVSYNYAFRWFSDYKTEIRSPNEEKYLGTLKEDFFFLNTSKIPQEIIEARNKKYHNLIENFQRPETVLYHKKSIKIKEQKTWIARRYNLNLIFRFNIHKFLTNADDPYQAYLYLDEISNELKTLNLHKVYHINIIMRKSFFNSKNIKISLLNKFRLIVDKNGIRRVEHVV